MNERTFSQNIPILSESIRDLNSIAFGGIATLLTRSLLLRLYDTVWKNNLINELYHSSADISDKVLTSDQLTGLPKPVQKYFSNVISETRPYISYLRLKHDGYFKLSLDQE